jgi:hypothetical protein
MNFSLKMFNTGKYKSTDAAKPYNEKSNIKMTDNFVAHLFSQIEVKKHGTFIDDIEFPGIASTVKVCVEYSGLNIYNGEAKNSGFKTKIGEDTNFEALGKLGDLGLRLFNDINIPIYKGGLEITFIRNDDNNVPYR